LQCSIICVRGFYLCQRHRLQPLLVLDSAHYAYIWVMLFIYSHTGYSEFTNSFFNHIINQSQVHWNDKIKSFLWSFTIEYFFVYYIEYPCALLWEKFSGRSTEIFKGEVHLEKRAESCPCENTDGAMWHEQAQEHISWLVADASIVRQKIKWSPFPFLCVVKQFFGISCKWFRLFLYYPFV